MCHHIEIRTYVRTYIQMYNTFITCMFILEGCNSPQCSAWHSAGGTALSSCQRRGHSPSESPDSLSAGRACSSPRCCVCYGCRAEPGVGVEVGDNAVYTVRGSIPLGHAY